MRKIEFFVPTEVLAEFSEEMVKRNLNNSITGTTDDGEIAVEVDYDKSETDDIDALEELLGKLCEDLEDEK
jgi:hypothetical protein